MERFLKKRKKIVAKKLGAIPGTLLYTGIHADVKTVATYYTYDQSDWQREEITKLSDLEHLEKLESRWLSVIGLTDKEFISGLEKKYEIHKLSLEDILNSNHRPKMDEFDNYLHLSMKLYHYDGEGKYWFEQISIVLQNNTVISFQETPTQAWTGIKERIEQNKGLVRKHGADYLFYLLVDTCVDSLFPIIDSLNEKIDSMENDLLNINPKDGIENILTLKKEINNIRKNVVPLRRIGSDLINNEGLLSDDDINPYLKDIDDHITNIAGQISSMGSHLDTILDLMISLNGHKLNEVMKTLTIIATIFMPLTFIAGIYGMNFKNMPELESTNGYFITLVVMGLISVLMAIYIRRKNWL